MKIKSIILRLSSPCLLLLLFACSGTQSVEPSNEIANFQIDANQVIEYPADATFQALQAEEILNISPTENQSPVIGPINQVKVLSDNSIVAFDYGTVQVHHFDQNGNYLTSFGRAGSGPGEFSNEATIQLHGNEIYLFERLQYKIDRFSNLDGEWVHTETIPIVNIEESIPLSLYKVTEEHLWMQYRFTRENQHGHRESIHHVTMVDRKDTQSAQTWVATLPPMSLMTEDLDGFIATYPIPYSPRPVLSITSENEIILARTDNFLFYRIDPNGGETLATTLPVEPIRLTLEDKKDFSGFSARIHQLARDHMPETRPAIISRVIPDADNGFWAGYQEIERNINRWVYIDPSGTILYEVDLPASFMPHQYKDSIIYGLESDEFGENTIKAFHIE